ncbi:response regulator [Chenggangzhangella methanolivorans]|uniref:Response regulator n=1 Tax=Chenggangzhangella methanolivorans TaxID=1437009 RepID=A0A9E6REQ8_9HYPH|nr:response regulator [Chenggangzhangella methanolivorans]QZN99855.1 response regulator [Chenggangzhangella methanolivorans]
MRVLYVDDEPDIREIARIALDLDDGMVIETAASGLEAIDKAAAWRPDVILLDVMMPEMDGPTTLAELRARDDTRAIPVVFITARTQTHEVERFRSLGACAVIAKPFDPMLLAAQVRAVSHR